ncbi:CBS domain-containing protein [Desulfovibrio ferrophilus]|uniref:CBS domain containing membrane protein n=1 Tax=Desulfovibrio ferrophilus TaxID=241368 RepID=A0A2Z6AWI8_9BACT|nr:CBS domain-containing protein [Desulfovibrio ferrophilus]BBD07609.1 CBS domain containing membrane protein [Desulfovibrio ferrophilus]
MLTAKDIMTSDPITLKTSDDVANAAAIMIEKRINGLPVVHDDGTLAGILCQSDLVAQQKRLRLPSVFTLLDGMIPLSSTKDLQQEMEKITALTVGQAMTPDPKTVTPDTPIDEIASLMVENKYHTLPVMDGDSLVGVLGKEDVLRTLLPGGNS